jgi:hypothetical protein
MGKIHEAFNGIEKWLGEKLEVTDVLLRELKDNELIFNEHVETINATVSKSKKVDELLRVLERRDDSALEVFCNILDNQGQQHVAKEIRSNANRKRLNRSSSRADASRVCLRIMLCHPREKKDMYSIN